MAAKKSEKPEKGREQRDEPAMTPERVIPEAPLAEEGDGKKATPGRHRGGKGFGKGFPW